MSVRAACAANGVAKTTLHRRLCGATAGSTQGHPSKLTEGEKGMIAAATGFAHRGTPLSRTCLAELAQAYISRLAPARRAAIGFKEDFPGARWVREVIADKFGLQRKQTLDAARAEAMDPRNLAAHFVRLGALCSKYDITQAGQVLNLDESGFNLKERKKGFYNARSFCGREAVESSCGAAWDDGEVEEKGGRARS
jgi:hypothetical protein